ncbi:MAG: CAAD domain-containing protein [Chroococcidiopsidaceae cyanobacterium CP_BM_ER_R8_30]|nr:CAAD domain-containing protein [Chroococcidiopsidaceae cyanobacterium CP_BM_ER_R8_30]
MSIGLILAAFITLRVVLAVIDVLNDIPLLAPALKLIGIGYSFWFTNRYLLRASTRQELSQLIQGFLKR